MSQGPSSSANGSGDADDLYVSKGAAESLIGCKRDGSTLSQLQVSLRLLLGLGTFMLGVATASVVAVTLVLSLTHNYHDLLTEFCDESTSNVVFHVSRHFAMVRREASFMLVECNSVDLLPNTSDPSLFVRHFGGKAWQTSFKYGYALANGISHGVGIDASIPIDQALVPRMAGAVILEIANAVTGTNSIGYANITTGEPFGYPRVITNSTYNVSKTASGAFLASDLMWSAPSVIFASNSSSIAVGGRWRIFSSTHQQFLHGYCGVYDFSNEISQFMSSLSILGSDGVAVVIHTATRSYLGGTIADAGVRIMPGTLPVIYRTRLALLDELEDKVMQSIVAAASRTNDALMSCTAPCFFIFHANEPQLQVGTSGRGLFDRYMIIHVERVSDEIGLDLRVIVAIHSDTFLGKARAGTVTSLILSGLVLAGLSLAPPLAFHWLIFRPLNRLCRALELLSRPSSQSTAGGTFKLREIVRRRSGQRRRGEQVRKRFIGKSLIKEVSRLEEAVASLLSELDVIQSYVNPSRWLIQHEHGVIHHLPSPCPSLTQQQTDDDALQNQGIAFDNPIHGQIDDHQQTSSHTRVGGLNHTGPKLATGLITFVVGRINTLPPEYTDGAPPTAFLTYHQQFVAAVLSATTRNGGECPVFYGDVVFAHFNVGQRLRRHADAAAAVANEATLAMQGAAAAPNMPTLGFAFGISTSVAMCGTLRGLVNSWSSFHVFGPCVGQAVSLSQTALRCGVGNLCSHHTSRLLSPHRWFPRHVRIGTLLYESQRVCISQSLLLKDIPEAALPLLRASNAAFMTFAEQGTRPPQDFFRRLEHMAKDLPAEHRHYLIQ